MPEKAERIILCNHDSWFNNQILFTVRRFGSLHYKIYFEIENSLCSFGVRLLCSLVRFVFVYLLRFDIHGKESDSKKREWMSLLCVSCCCCCCVSVSSSVNWISAALQGHCKSWMAANFRSISNTPMKMWSSCAKITCESLKEKWLLCPFLVGFWFCESRMISFFVCLSSGHCFCCSLFSCWAKINTDNQF